jgi:hypothetical protein
MPCNDCNHWLFSNGGTDGMCAAFGINRSKNRSPSHVPAYYPGVNADGQEVSSYVGVKHGQETVEITDDDGLVTGTETLHGWYRGLITHQTHTCDQWEAISGG